MTNYLRQNAWEANNGGNFKNADGSYTDLYWYAIGVGEMKAKPISDPTSWWFYAAIHGEYLTSFFGSGSEPTEYPNWTKIESIPAIADLNNWPSPNQRDLFWNQCQHGTWFFAPWHRGYLVALENLLRDIIVQKGGPSDWAFPYWNYLKEGQYAMPPAFSATTLPDGVTPNPLYVPERYGPNGDSNIYLVVGPSMTASINDECQWDTLYSSPTDPQNNTGTPSQNPGNIFGDHWGGAQTGFSHNNGGFGDLEWNPHNFAHSIIGGLKAQAWSNSGPQTFTVQANQPWQSTQITVKPGSTVFINASGSWTADPLDNNGQLYGPNGSPDVIVPASQPLYPIVGVPMGALIGRINGGTPFLIGAGSAVPDDVAGTLELCINDDLTGAYGRGLTDNSGSMNITFTATPSEEFEGLMADPGLAGLDPVFFLHHANIDRMWDAWITTGKNQNPTDPNWLTGPTAFGNSRFAMPMDTDGTPWYYTPNEMQNTKSIPYYGGSTYVYTYDDLSLTSYSNTPPVSNTGSNRLMKLGVTKSLKEVSMASSNPSSELIGASANGIKLNSGNTQVAVKLDSKGWNTVTNSLKSAVNVMPDEIFLLLENVKGTNNSNFLTVSVNNKIVNSVSLFGIRMASMENNHHGGSGLTFKFNITSIVDELFLAGNIDLNSLNVQISTKNPIATSSSITVGKISIYRTGQ